MKTILDLSNLEAKEFLLKKESYSNIDLPQYFNFQNLIDKIDKYLLNRDLKGFKNLSPRDFEDVNHKIITNKDGKYAWRPFQLIHPAIYVNLVNHITAEQNWQLIIERFKNFQSNNKIECHSLPIISEKEEKKDKQEQILTWWKYVEQKSLQLSLEYKFTIHTDITDCYSSIYTHSIPWALHTKQFAKQKENRNKDIIGTIIDNNLQDMSYGQTNGIPQGSTLMDFIAEIVLGYVDSLLSEKLMEERIEDYKILRYRDDYRIFTNNSLLADEIAKYLSEILSDLGLKINPEKTYSSSDIIKSSIKSDKRYWIANKRIAGNKQKWLLQLYFLSENYPNSGTVDTELRDFLKVLEKSKKVDYDYLTLISLVTQIALRNPRVTPTAIAILSLLLYKIEKKKERKKLIEKIHSSFASIPNSSYIMIWFQRLYLTIDTKKEFDESLCKKVMGENINIWNSEWITKGLKNILEKTSIIEEEKVKTVKTKFSKTEIKFVSKLKYEGY